MSTLRTAELTLASRVASRANAYVVLTKPDVSFLVLITTAAGFYMGSRGPVDWLHMVHTVFGTMLIAGGTAALNHYIEARLRSADEKNRFAAAAERSVEAAASTGVWDCADDRRGPVSVFRSGYACGRVGRGHLPWLFVGVHAAEEAHGMGDVCGRVSRCDSTDDRLGGGDREA